MNTNQTIYTLESLRQMKDKKAMELEETKERIIDLTHAITAPPATNNNMELWMHYAGQGMAAYKGIMTCIKLYRRFKGTFAKKKKSKSLFS